MFIICSLSVQNHYTFCTDFYTLYKYKLRISSKCIPMRVAVIFSPLFSQRILFNRELTSTRTKISLLFHDKGVSFYTEWQF